MDRRSFMIGTTALAAAGPVFAQDAFPSHAITIINAFPPGGANDIATRPFASALEPVVKQPVVVETKAGAGGQVGAQVAANAKPDGYTLLSHNNEISGYEEVDKIFGRQPKTTRADFIPLGEIDCRSGACARQRATTLQDAQGFYRRRQKAARSNHFSSGGLYGATHLPVALLEKATGIPKLRHLPTNGGGPAITALLGNNAQMSTQTVSASLSHIKAGKLRPLASFGGKRSASVPDVPTLKELGYDVEYYLWVGIFAPKGTPSNIVATLSAAIEKAGMSDAYKTAMSNAGLQADYLNAAAFAKFWAEDAKRSDEAVKLIGRVQG